MRNVAPVDFDQLGPVVFLYCLSTTLVGGYHLLVFPVVSTKPATPTLVQQLITFLTFCVFYKTLFIKRKTDIVISFPNMASKNIVALRRTLKTIRSNSMCCSQIRRGSNWTQEKTVKSPFKNADIPKCTLFDYVWQNLEKWPERTLAVCATTGRGYTYEQVFKLSSTFAANLRKKFGIRDGDTVSVMLPNIPDYPIVAMGVLEAGGLLSTINPVYTAHEVQRQLLMSNTKVIVTLPELVGVVREALKIAKLNLNVIVVKTNGEATPQGTALFSELIDDVHVDTSCLKEVRRSHNDVCLLPYSSGTTGLPKGVELTNRNIIANCEQINEQAIICHNETTATHQDVVMCVLPFFHIYGGNVVMFHKMSQGLKLVTLSKMHPETFLPSLHKQKANLLFAAPPLVILMASHSAATAETYKHLEVIVSGAAPLAASDAHKLFEKAGRVLDFRQGYGLTETSPVISQTPKGSDCYGSVGVALPSTELRVVDGNGNNLGPGEKGELLVRGPQVMKGYRDNPEANAQVFTEDGWFRTGDLAAIDENGFIRISDRLKELIKVKGFQVPPAELEAVLREHPAVGEAAVIGVPHDKSGEVPRAFIVLRPGQQANEDDIRDFVKERVAPYKRIKDITFLDAIPKNTTGKIMRKELKAKYCN